MWKFRELRTGEPERDPHEAEFFRLTDPAEAVVREVIQNSLDAKRTGEHAIVVRFTFDSVKKESVESYFGDLKPHLQAYRSALSEYESSDTISFLTIEDFGTTGLDGAIWPDGPRPGPRSNFYDFWWAEGKSSKGGQEAGRWGLGKTTFHISSKLRSFWGSTARQDDSQELLMGKALLKTHRLDNAVYHYDGYFTDENYRPVRNKERIQQFKRKFAISRNNEPGLSLVIPMPDEEITASGILKSAIIHYFYPIMKGCLSVDIRESGREIRLNTDNLMNIALEQSWQDTSWEGVDVGELLQFIKNLIHATDIIEIGIPDDESREITEDSFGNRIDELKNSFNACSPLRFKIPVRIGSSNGHTATSYFEVYLKKHQQLTRAEEFYFRSGIRIIPTIKTLGNRPVFGMLVAEDPHVSTFLGDAENPAHTEWNERTEGFRDKYQNAVKTLRFIKKSMSRIVLILDQPAQERQRDFLKEIFFVPERLPEQEEDTTIKPDIDEDKIKRKPQPFEIIKINRGFRVSLKKTDIPLPLRARITVAYDVRKRNPFRQYEPADFDLGGTGIAINPIGCTIIHRSRNTIEYSVTGSGFKLEVTGFDPNRDIVVDVKEIKNEAQV